MPPAYLEVPEVCHLQCPELCHVRCPLTGVPKCLRAKPLSTVSSGLRHGGSVPASIPVGSLRGRPAPRTAECECPRRCHSQPLGFGAVQEHALDERCQDLNGKPATLVPRLARIEPKHPTGSRSEDAVGLVLGGVDSPVTGPSWGRTRGL